MHVRGLLIIMDGCVSNILLAVSFKKQFITFLKKSFLFSWIQSLKKISVRCYYQLIYKNSIFSCFLCVCFLFIDFFFFSFVLIFILFFFLFFFFIFFFFIYYFHRYIFFLIFI